MVGGTISVADSWSMLTSCATSGFSSSLTDVSVVASSAGLPRASGISGTSGTSGTSVADSSVVTSATSSGTEVTGTSSGSAAGKPVVLDVSSAGVVTVSVVVGDELVSAVVLLNVVLDSLTITVVGAAVLVVVTTGVVGSSPKAAEVELTSSVVSAASVELGKPDVEISASVV